MLLYDADTKPVVESAILRQIKRFGGKPPDRVLNKPKLVVGLRFFFDAFYDLDTERSLADLQPIPWSRIVGYAKYHELNRGDTDDLLYFVREADNAFLAKLAERRKREAQRR